MHPVLFRVAGLTVHSYGVVVVIATLAAASWVLREEVSADSASLWSLELMTVALVGGLLGARVALWVAAGGGRPGAWIASSGGFIQAGVGVGLAAAAGFARIAGRPVLASLDRLVPGAPLGMAIGRIGCWLAGCCYGAEAASGARVVYSDPWAHALTGVPLGIPLHPTQVYLGLGSLATFLAVGRLANRGLRPGALLGCFLLLDGVARLMIDGLRGDARAVLGPLATGQVLALVGIGFGGALVAVAGRGQRSGAVPA